MSGILIATPLPLYPIDMGVTVRIIKVGEFLSNHGFKVHLLCGDIDPEGKRRVEAITRADVYTYSRESGLLYRNILNWPKRLSGLERSNPYRLFAPHLKRDLLRVLGQTTPDALQCELIFPSYHVSILAEAAKKCRIPLVVAEHNIEFERLASQYGLQYDEKDKLRIFESRLCNCADVVTTVSEDDSRKLKDIGVHTPIEVVPNGVDYHRYQIDEQSRMALRQRYAIAPHERVLVFHGTLLYPPNLQANNLLINRIFPKICDRHDSVRLLLIGPGHTREHGQKVIRLPAIPHEELPSHLSMADIGVVPLTAGSGTRLKIIEYFALGIPTVSTQIGAEGLPVTHGQSIIIARDTDQEFVKCILTLLQDKNLRKSIGNSGKQLARYKLDWGTVLMNYLQVYDRLSVVPSASK